MNGLAVYTMEWMMKFFVPVCAILLASGFIGCAANSSQDESASAQEMPAASEEETPSASAAMSGSAAAMDPEAQSAITSEQVLEALEAGNQRFVDGVSIERDFSSQVEATATGQYPGAVILSCIDSRVPAEIVFDQGVGDVFSARVAGNIIDPHTIGSIEFATKVAGAKLVVVMGHTSCGAVKGSCDNVQLGHISSLVDTIQPSVEAVTPEGETCASSNAALVDEIAAHNVERTLDNLRAESDIISTLESDGDIMLVGAMYDVATGRVTFME
jgi:carbonic anhydrase